MCVQWTFTADEYIYLQWTLTCMCTIDAYCSVCIYDLHVCYDNVMCPLHCRLYYVPGPPQPIDSEVNSQQVKRIAHQPDPMQQQHEEAHAHYLKEQPPSPFPLMANPPNNVYSQGYGYQPSPVYASSRGPAGMAPSPSPPPKHNPRQEVPEDDDYLPPPIMLPNQPPTQSRSPVKVRAASSQPYNTPYQLHYQPQFQQLARYAHVDVGMTHFGPPNKDHSHVQSEWRQPSDMQVYVNPNLTLE